MSRVAAELALRATRLAPHDAEAFFQAAVGFKAAGDVERAITFYRRAVRLDPGYTEARTNLGSLLERRGDINLAQYHYRQAIAANGRDHKAHFNLGSTLLKRGRLQTASEHFRRVTELRPADTEARIQLASTLALDAGHAHRPESSRTRRDKGPAGSCRSNPRAVETVPRQSSLPRRHHSEVILL